MGWSVQRCSSGGPYHRVELFSYKRELSTTQPGTVDFCRWCRSPSLSGEVLLHNFRPRRSMNNIKRTLCDWLAPLIAGWLKLYYSLSPRYAFWGGRSTSILAVLPPLQHALFEVAGTRVFKPLTTSSPHPSDLVGSYMMGIFFQTKLKPLWVKSVQLL